MDAVQQQPGGGLVMGGGVEPKMEKKLKFTVSVRGHQWSSARQRTEALKDFLVAVQRNARRLEYIEEGDIIQRLQLVHGDGSEPEDLDVDATLDDVMICMGAKQLVAVVMSTKWTHHNPPPNATANCSVTANLGAAFTTDIIVAGTGAPIDDNVIDTTPAITNTMLVLNQGSHGHGQRTSLATPGSANMLAPSSSHYHRVKVEQAGLHFGSHKKRVGTRMAVARKQRRDQKNIALPASSTGFESLTSRFHPPLPTLPVENTHAVTYFPYVVDARLQSLCKDHIAAGAEEAMNVSNGGVVHSPTTQRSDIQVLMSEMENVDPGNAVVRGSLPKNDDIMNLPVTEPYENDDPSSLAIVNAARNAPTGDVEDEGLSKEGNELVYFVKQGGKKGRGGPEQLRISDLSPHFHLTVMAAAKKIGVSTTTLKKANRKLGLKRWPGREIRGLKKAIVGVEHLITKEQDVGLEVASFLWNGVQQLHHEMDHQLVHGSPTQHSSAVRSDMYKWLYQRGWRSKDVSFDIVESRPSGLGPASAEKASRTTSVTTPTAAQISKGGTINQQPMNEPVSNQHNQITDVHNKEEYHSSTAMRVFITDTEGLSKERTLKRPRRACRTDAGAVAGQDLQSNTLCDASSYEDIKHVVADLELEGAEPDA